MSDNEKSTQTEEPNFRYNAALAQDIENKWQKIWDEQHPGGRVAIDDIAGDAHNDHDPDQDLNKRQHLLPLSPKNM